MRAFMWRYRNLLWNNRAEKNSVNVDLLQMAPAINWLP